MVPGADLLAGRTEGETTDAVLQAKYHKLSVDTGDFAILATLNSISNWTPVFSDVVTYRTDLSAVPAGFAYWLHIMNDIIMLAAQILAIIISLTAALGIVVLFGAGVYWLVRRIVRPHTATVVHTLVANEEDLH